MPDNAKAVVSKTCLYEPVLNPAYLDFARHYDCAVVPARVRRPQDKVKVENAVQMLERALFPELMVATFFDIESLNVALREGVDRVNAKPFQKRDGSRHSRLAEERAALKPLHGQFKVRKHKPAQAYSKPSLNIKSCIGATIEIALPTSEVLPAVSVAVKLSTPFGS